ncbi:MAG TPA: histidine kinase [Saprospiraceae bacterium]|nr:histidine kinase [Saprospiraceae bacterium]
MKPVFILLFLFGLTSAYAQEYYFRQMPTEFGREVQHIKVLFQGTDQMLWLGTDKGLYSFDGKILRLASRPDGLSAAVTAIAESQKGEIIAGYEDGYMHSISVKGYSKRIPTDSLNGIPITKILPVEDVELYIATYGAGLWRMDENGMKQIQFQHFDDINDIYDALIDQNGRLWAASDHGIWIYNKQPKETLENLNRDDGLPDEIVTELHELDNGDIAIGLYDHGFGRFLQEEKKFHIDWPISPNDGNVVSVANGHKKEIWFASERTILSYSIDHLSQNVKLPSQIKDRIEDILFDRTGNLWVASGNKLFVANTQFELRIPGIKGIQAVTVLDNKLWLGCENGLYSLDLDKGVVQQELKKEHLNILSLYHDMEGILWIGTFGQGLFVYDPQSKISKHLTETEGISNNSILNIDGYQHDVWLATLGGITEIHWPTNAIRDELKITLFGQKFNFPAGYVYDVYVANDKKVWFGTDGKGLYFLDGKELKVFTKPVQFFGKDSFDLRTIYSITGDEKNNIWVSAQKGNILKLDAKGNIKEHIPTPYGSLNSLNSTGQGEIIMVREGFIQINNPLSGIAFFGPTTGLISFSPNINSTAQDADGSVWIADADKVLHYKPVNADTSMYVHMHIVDVTPGSLNMTEPITLKPDSNFIDFRFTGLWYPDPQSVRYRYMLQGHDQDWIYTQEGRAVYSKLSPGNYTFIVAGSYNDDFTQSLPIKRAITVLPPFYLTWWFILGTLFLISFLTYRYMRDRISRINQFHQLEKEKTTLQLNAIQAQVNPHFLFNSFNTLSGIIEEDQEAAVDYVDQLSSFFRGVLLHRNAELISLAEEIDIMRNYTYILTKRYGDNIRIVEEITSTEGFIAPLTLQLLVENAIKHNIVSKEKPLKIIISINDQWLIASNPIQPKIQGMIESTGFGLSSLLARYQYLTRKKIEITNDGNIFIVKIPIIQPNS